MHHLMITAVPVHREDNPMSAPAGAIAARLEPGEQVELRFYRKNGMTHCCLGLENRAYLQQAAAVLKDAGFLTREETPPALPGSGRLLCRGVERQTVVCAGRPPEQILLPTPILRDPLRLEAVPQALDRMRDGSGFLFRFRRSQSLPAATVSHLHRSSPVEGTVAYSLLYSTELYEGVGLVWGPSANLAELTSEVVYGFPGLRALPAAPISPGGDLFSHLAKQDTAPPVLKPLSTTFLREEMDALGDVTASAGDYGLPLNPDTIFGMPRRHTVIREKCLLLGTRAGGEPVQIPMKRLCQHMFLGGPPGSGKGNQLFSTVFQLHKEGIPFLLIEPAKEEMHHLRKTIPGLNVWQPKAGSYVLNPFSLEGDITLGEMRPSLLQLMRLCFKLDGPLEELFSDAMNRCFAKNGFSDDDAAGAVGTTPFGMSEFMEEYVKLLNEKGYSQRTRDDMKTAGTVRLNTLFSQNRAVFDTVRSVPIQELLNGENLIQLNCLPTQEAKQMFASMLLLFISTWLRLRGTHCADRPVKLAIILDESHNLLQPVTDSQGRVFSFARDFRNMLLELRSQGVAIVLADQNSANLPREITDVCATKVFMGHSASCGIADTLPGAAADETAMEHLYLMGPGEGCVFTHGMPHAEYFTSPNVIDQFHLEIPCPRENRFLARNPRFTLETFCECRNCPAKGTCTHADKAAARRTASALYQRYGSSLGTLVKKDPSKEIGKVMVQVIGDTYKAHTAPQRICTVIQFVREFNREFPGALDLKLVLHNAQAIWSALKAKK